MGTKLRIQLTIIFLFFSIITFGQEKWTYQKGSIYKANNVKARKWFIDDKLVAITFYDREGRMIKYQHAPFIGGEQITTYYEYDNNGNLTNQVDTNRNARTDKKIEVSKYKIEYENNSITNLTKFNPDGTIFYIDKYQNNGRKQIRDWYISGFKYREDTTEYIDDLLHKKEYYGWENSKKNKWHYTYEYKYENGRIKEFTKIFSPSDKETINMEYDKNGLLIKAIKKGFVFKAYTTTVTFKYEYY